MALAFRNADKHFTKWAAQQTVGIKHFGFVNVYQACSRQFAMN